MTPLHAIISILIVQIFIYLFLDEINLRIWKYLILVLILIAYVFVLPNYFFPDISTDKPRCGMPALRITLAFWILGCGTTLIAHISYTSIRTLINKQRKNSK